MWVPLKWHWSNPNRNAQLQPISPLFKGTRLLGKPFPVSDLLLRSVCPSPFLNTSLSKAVDYDGEKLLQSDEWIKQVTKNCRLCASIFLKNTKMETREKSLEGYLSKLLTMIISGWWVCWWFLVHSFDLRIPPIFSVINKYLSHIRKKGF